MPNRSIAGYGTKYVELVNDQDSMPQLRVPSFRSWFVVYGAALLAANLGEAWVAAFRAEGRLGPLAALGLAAKLGAYSLFAWVALAALAAAVTAILCDGLSKRPLLVAGMAVTGRDLAAAALLAAPLQLGAAYAITLWAAKLFNNRELAALVVVVASTASLLVVVALWTIAARLSARVRGRVTQPWLAGRVPFLPGALAIALLVVWLSITNRSGFAQLEPELWIAPAAAALVAAAALRFRLAERVRGRASSVALGVALPLCLATSLSVAFYDATVANVLASHGSWSRYGVELLRKLTDFDGDGYSSWLSGGDCAPFDPDVAPGKPEVPEDGKDNNCVGGDAKRSGPVARPTWHAPAAHDSRRGMNLVVVTVETLRHDRVSFLGYGRDTTPRLRELAKDAVRFRRMYASAPMTRLAISSLFSSFAPSEIRWLPQATHKRMRKIAPSTPWLPAILQRAGYQTFAVLADFRAFTDAESAGFDRGFERYDVSTRLRYSGGTMHGFPGEEQVTKAIAYLDSVRAPFFLWLHLFEPHFTYEQPPAAPVFGADEQSRYDAEIWEADRQIGRLVDRLREGGQLERTILLVTGDHGEAFGEHGDRWHGSNLYDPQVRTAALLRVPGLPARTVEEAVTFTDLAPTLLNLLGVERDFGRLRGRNLAPLLLGGALSPERFVIEGFSVDDGHAFMMAVVQMPHKLVYVEDGHKLELFDLFADPEERAPLSARSSGAGAELEGHLFEYLESTAGRHRAP